MSLRWTLCSLALLLSLGLLDTLDAAEQRCNELGANCICSEPLNTNVYTGGPSFFNAADTTSQQCSLESTNAPISRNSATIVGANDPTVLARLPAGHSVNFYMRANDGHTGIFWLGHDLGRSSPTPPTARVAYRWYRFYSANHQFNGEGACENSKLAQSGPIVDHTGQRVHAYAWGGLTNSVDCCFVGPNYSSSAPQTWAAWKDRWWRFEIVIRNRGAGQTGFTLQMYGKDVTNNGAELTMVDSSIPCLGCGPNPWTSTQAANLIPTSTVNSLASNNYRQGTCTGFQGYSHFMVAGWDTDQGQRIGPAYEVERVLANPAPAQPGNVRTR